MEEKLVRNRYKNIMKDIKTKMHIDDEIKLLFRYRKKINGYIQYIPYKRMILEGDIIDDKVFTGIIAHELSHVKLKHLKENFYYVFLFIAMCIISVLLTILVINPIIKLLIIGVILFMIIFGIFRIIKEGKRQEFEADAIAAEYVGYDIIRYAIGSIRKRTITHPSPYKRLKALEKS